ncbi:hypothetical protein P8605_32770, partial [Streptomyces sp. T-3]|nr:hypothetical protein [Streptomyces sp. T-3]
PVTVDHSSRTTAPGPAVLTALAMASVRISRGDPTLHEVTAIAELLTERLRRAAATNTPAVPRPVPLPTPRADRSWYLCRAPGARAS